MFSKEVFGQRLLALRIGRKETQPMLAELLGIKKSQISEIENGHNATTAERIFILCEHYHVSADYLLGLSDDPKPYKRKKEPSAAGTKAPFERGCQPQAD